MQKSACRSWLPMSRVSNAADLCQDFPVSASSGRLVLKAILRLTLL